MVLKLTPISEDRFMAALEVLPPRLQFSHGFLLGEPADHRVCRVTGHIAPVFDPYFCRRDGYWSGSEALTAAEFKAITVAQFHAATDAAGVLAS